MKFRETTEKQRNEMIKKLANTMIDNITMEAEDKARDFIKDLFDMNIDSEEDMTIQYKYYFNFNGSYLKILLASDLRERGIE